MNEVRVLKIRLGPILVGYITYYRDGKSLFLFDESYIALRPDRPVLSLSFTVPGDEAATEQKLRQHYTAMLKLPPYFSNLLPEGALREYLVKKMRIHADHEFYMLEALGANLPGAVIAAPADLIPAAARQIRPGAHIAAAPEKPLPFSLGGAQLKFSMIEHGGRFSLTDGVGEWIIKPPHPTFPEVPANEFAMMKLAQAAGVVIPDVRLVPIKDLDLGDLAELSIPRGEDLAYAIKRFDRTPEARIHAEDFAQVFSFYSNREYDGTNYESIGRLIFKVFPDPFGQIEQFLRRLVVNILVGNSDAHLKNWSILYEDGFRPRLSPGYDILSTIQYARRNISAALNLGNEKRFYATKREHFERLARKIGIPADFALGVVKSTVSTAAERWESVLSAAPISSDLRDALRQHWERLDPFLRPTLARSGERASA
jgi:serine/threonine-protein kinase HipA